VGEAEVTYMKQKTVPQKQKYSKWGLKTTEQLLRELDIYEDLHGMGVVT